MARAPSFSRVPDSDAAPYPLERRRFYILAVNSMLALMQCLNWFTFSSVDVARVRGYYGAHVIGAYEYVVELIEGCARALRLTALFCCAECCGGVVCTEDRVHTAAARALSPHDTRRWWRDGTARHSRRVSRS